MKEIDQVITKLDNSMYGLSKAVHQLEVISYLWLAGTVIWVVSKLIS